MDKRLPLYIADINPTDNDGLLSLSLTKKPATGLFCRQIDNNTIFAPIVAANKPIYRNNDIYGEHYLMFTPDVIRDIMLNNNQRHVGFDMEHTGTPIEGIEWLESFQIDYTRGKVYRGYQGLTVGTWCGVFRVNPNMVFRGFEGGVAPFDSWGFSVSGVFTYHEVKLSEAIEFYNKIRM